MTSNDKNNKSGNGSDTQSKSGQAKTDESAKDTSSQSAHNPPRQSAQARARAAKKSVTIDLEAKDVTDKSSPKAKTEAEAKSAASKKPDELKKESSSDKETPKAAASSPTAADESKKSADNKKPDEKKPDAKKPDRKKAEAASLKSGVTKKTEAKPATVAIAKTEKKARAGGGMFAGLFSSLIGGLIAIAGFIGLQTAGVLAPFENAQEGLDIGALEQRVATLENLPALEIPEGVDPNAFDNLTKRVISLEEVLAKPAVPQEVGARLTALESRLSDIEASGPSVADGQTDTSEQNVRAFAGLNDRLTAIEARLSVLEDEDQTSSTFEEKIAALDAKIASLTGIIQSDTAKDQDINKLITDLATGLDGLTAEFDALKNLDVEAGAKISDLSEKLAETQETLAGQIAGSGVILEIAQSVALDTLKQQGASGAPFDDALSALKKTGFKSENIALIEPYADKGLPKKEVLRQAFDGLAGTVAARGSADGDSDAAKPLSALEKLARNARSVINIRRTDVESGEDGGPAQKLNDAFVAGDVALFVEVMNTLGEREKELFSDWLPDWKASVALSKLSLSTDKPADDASVENSDSSSKSSNDITQ